MDLQYNSFSYLKAYIILFSSIVYSVGYYVTDWNYIKRTIHKVN